MTNEPIPTQSPELTAERLEQDTSLVKGKPTWDELDRMYHEAVKFIVEFRHRAEKAEVESNSLRSELATAKERIGELEEKLDDISDSLPQEFTAHKRSDITGVSLLDDIRDLVKESGKRCQWQDISTAPKDGTDILLGSPPQEFNGEPTTRRTTVGQWVTAQDGDDDYSGWASWDGGFTEENPPTHWMPLPEPPTSHSTKAEGASHE